MDKAQKIKEIKTTIELAHRQLKELEKAEAPKFGDVWLKEFGFVFGFSDGSDKVKYASEGFQIYKTISSETTPPDFNIMELDKTHIERAQVDEDYVSRADIKAFSSCFRMGCTTRAALDSLLS